MIGWYCIATFPYYDNQHKKMSFKKRPMLIIGQADSSDYVTLSVSKVSHRANIEADYDLSIKIIEYPLMNLTFDSYIRTHKQTITNRAGIRPILDLKVNYPDLWIEVLSKVEAFQKQLIAEGLA